VVENSKRVLLNRDTKNSKRFLYLGTKVVIQFSNYPNDCSKRRAAIEIIYIKKYRNQTKLIANVLNR
jgi:hypothetical protein